MKLLRRKTKSFDIQVEDLTLHITASDDFAEEARAQALSFWEQIQSYALRNPEFRRSKRPLRRVPEDAPAIVREMVAASREAGVGPMFTFRGAVNGNFGLDKKFAARPPLKRVVRRLLEHASPWHLLAYSSSKIRTTLLLVL